MASVEVKTASTYVQQRIHIESSSFHCLMSANDRKKTEK